MGQKTLLIITDGIGYSRQEQYNAFSAAKKPTYNKLFQEVPYSLIHTYGLHVGLPEGQMGNSEVGHMTLGAGRVLYQDLVKISKAIDEGSLASNSVLQELLEKTHTIHLIGLLSDGGVHSHIDHIMSTAKILAQNGCHIYLHAITDGRDVSPTSATTYVQKLQSILSDNITLATLGGRFYAMDRDKRWERVEKGYNVIVNASSQTALSPREYILLSYDNGITDEFLEPVAFNGYNGMNEGEGVIFMNFRSDRARELSQALADPTFTGFERTLKNIYFITATEYAKDFLFPVMFPKENPKKILAEIVANQGLSQFHTAETEKYAHVTFFFNGGQEEPFANETRVLIPSPNVRTYDEQPQMSAFEVTEAVEKALDNGYDFIVVNYANGDMVGHTGNFDAAIQAVETVDTCLGRILAKANEHRYAVILTSDHGNCEEMRDEEGNVLTNHTVGDVWCFVRAQGVNEVKKGALNNIAATVLKLMDIEKPDEMDEALI